MAIMQKSFFKSKTNWSGIIVAILGILQGLVTMLSTHGDWKSWVLAIATFLFGGALIIVRTFFTDPAKK